MASVFLFVGLMAVAQEAGDANSENIANETRPAESDLLFDDTGAPEALETPEDNVELPGVGFSDFVRMILVLGLVIGLIYGFVWLLKRFSSQKAESEEIINLLSTRPLKGDTALHLIEVGSRMFLVGSCSSSVNLISEIDDDESIDGIRLGVTQSAGPVSGGFAKLFRDKFGSDRFPRKSRRHPGRTEERKTRHRSSDCKGSD